LLATERLKLTALLLLTASAAWSQNGLGTINGTVVDKSGAVVVGAKATLVQQSTKSTRETVTNAEGLFNFPSNVASTYTLTIEAPGFRQKQLDNIVLNSYQEISLSAIQLELGSGPASEVTVSAEQQLVKDTGERAETLQAQQVSETPNNGRNWANLLKIIPGAMALNDSAVQGREYGYYGYTDYSINGKPATDTQVNLDGGSIIDHGSDGKTTVAPSLESIQEVAILTNNFTAEYGNRAGASINIVTKSGTNQLHGVAFENLRNEDLNANSWSNNYNGLVRPEYRYNYYGANLGGPIKKNKMFFFYNFEDFHQNVPGSIVQSREPTALERTGDFSQTVNATGSRPTIYQQGTQYNGTPTPYPNNIIPPSIINPLGKAIMNLYPLPNNPSNLNQNYILSYQAITPRLSQSGKYDWNINERNRLYLRYNEDEGTNTALGTYNTSAGLPFNLMKQPRPDRSAVGNITHVFSPNLVMEGLFSWSYDHVQVLPADPAALDTSKLGLSGLPSAFPVTNSILPGINSGGVYPTFTFNRLPAEAIANEWQSNGILTWTKDRHTFKFGVQSFIDTKQENTASNDKGTYDFSASHSQYDTNYGPSNILVGALNEYSQVSSIAHKNSIFHDFQFFAQDSWKIKHNLTLDYGIRVYHMPAEADISPNAVGDAVFIPSLYNPATAPRYYIPDPVNSKLVIDPANPNNPLPTATASSLLYTLVPGSGNPLDGVVPVASAAGGGSGLLSPKYLLFAPRGGFAWSPERDPKMVIRGGFGWGYNRNTIGDAVTAFNNGLTQTADYLETSLSTLAANTGVPKISPASYAARDNSQKKAPTIYDFSLSMQHELPWKMVGDVAYVGNIQRHQPIDVNLNAIAPGTAFQSQYIDSTNAGYNYYGPVTASNPGPLPGSNAMNALVMRPYQGFNTLTATANVANNHYDAMQMKLSKRFGAGLVLQAAYSYQILFTEQENLGDYNYLWKQYTGNVSANNRYNTFTTNYIYEIPKIASFIRFDNRVGRAVLNGWQFAHLLAYFGGQPYNPSFSILESNTSTSVNTGLVILGTPDFTPRILPTGNTAGTGASTYFNPGGFTVPGTYPASNGTGLVNYLTGPGAWQNDMNLVKVFHITEKKTLEFRVNAYNVFNMVRRTANPATNAVNSSIQFKANGSTFAQGFTVYNTPDQLAARATNGTNSAQTIYNQYRTGVGAPNLTNVEPMRILEVGLKFRF
jgi:hypothetical protein